MTDSARDRSFQASLIVNLEPRKMMGLESNGMILSVKYGDGYRVVEFDDSVLPGSDIS